jgi:hypothetical protein
VRQRAIAPGRVRVHGRSPRSPHLHDAAPHAAAHAQRKSGHEAATRGSRTASRRREKLVCISQATSVRRRGHPRLGLGAGRAEQGPRPKHDQGPTGVRNLSTVTPPGTCQTRRSNGPREAPRANQRLTDAAAANPCGAGQNRPFLEGRISPPHFLHLDINQDLLRQTHHSGRDPPAATLRARRRLT